MVGRTDGCSDGQTNGRTDKQMGGWTDGRTDGGTDGLEVIVYYSFSAKYVLVDEPLDFRQLNPTILAKLIVDFHLPRKR